MLYLFVVCRPRYCGKQNYVSMITNKELRPPPSKLNWAKNLRILDWYPPFFWNFEIRMVEVNLLLYFQVTCVCFRSTYPCLIWRCYPGWASVPFTVHRYASQRSVSSTTRLRKTRYYRRKTIKYDHQRQTVSYACYTYFVKKRACSHRGMLGWMELNNEWLELRGSVDGFNWAVWYRATIAANWYTNRHRQHTYTTTVLPTSFVWGLDGKIPHYASSQTRETQKPREMPVGWLAITSNYAMDYSYRLTDHDGRSNQCRVFVPGEL